MKDPFHIRTPAWRICKSCFDTAEYEPSEVWRIARSRGCRSSQALLRGSERSFRRGGRAARSDVQTKLLASHERCRFKKQEQRILNVALLLFVSDSILKIELNAEA